MKLEQEYVNLCNIDEDFKTIGCRKEGEQGQKEHRRRNEDEKQDEFLPAGKTKQSQRE